MLVVVGGGRVEDGGVVVGDARDLWGGKHFRRGWEQWGTGGEWIGEGQPGDPWRVATWTLSPLLPSKEEKVSLRARVLVTVIVPMKRSMKPCFGTSLAVERPASDSTMRHTLVVSYSSLCFDQ